MSDGYELILTASRRLARLWHEEFAQNAGRRGLEAWEVPPVQSFETWVVEATAADDDPLLLSPLSSRALWVDMARRDGGGDPGALAGLLARAWNFIHLYGIDSSELKQEGGEEAARFLLLAHRYREILAHVGFEDVPQRFAQAAERLRRRGPPPGFTRLRTVGFLDPPPVTTHIFSALSETGVEVRDDLSTERESAGSPGFVVADNPEEEWRMAALWCGEILARDPHALVALVVPDLDAVRERLDRILDEVLEPQGILFPDRRRRAHNLAGGRPLDREPVVATALLLIRLAVAGLTPPGWSALVLSPYWGGGLSASRWRDERMLRDLPLTWSFRPEELPPVSFDSAGDLRRHLRLAGEGIRPPRRARFEAWIEWLRRVHERWSWPGPHLDSGAYQAWRAHEETLAELRRAGGLFPSGIDADSFLFLYEDALQTRLFQPEVRGARLLVLEPRDVPGLRLDALWVAGLHAGAWPRPVDASPFIPGTVARRHGLPRADVPAALAEARRLEAAWRRSTPSLVMSWAREAEGVRLRPSPLLRGLTSLEVRRPGVNDRGLRGRLFLDRATVGRESLAANDPAPCSGMVLRRGVDVLEEAALCSFRAFARRLGADPLPPFAVPLDPRFHGRLLHGILERLAREEGGWWEGTRTKLVGRIGDLVNEVLDAQAGDIGFTPGLRAVETDRLRRLLDGWLDLEEKAGKNRAWEVELETHYRAHGLELGLRTDRIDRDGRGRGTVLDYKSLRTHGALNRYKLSQGKPLPPQLALYALAHPEIAAVGYLAFVGETATVEPFLLGEADAPWSSLGRFQTVPDWSAYLARLRDELDPLFENVREGVTNLDPREEKICRTCVWAILCRRSSLLDDGGSIDDEEDDSP